MPPKISRSKNNNTIDAPKASVNTKSDFLRITIAIIILSSIPIIYSLMIYKPTEKSCNESHTISLKEQSAKLTQDNINLDDKIANIFKDQGMISYMDKILGKKRITFNAMKDERLQIVTGIKSFRITFPIETIKYNIDSKITPILDCFDMNGNVKVSLLLTQVFGPGGFNSDKVELFIISLSVNGEYMRSDPTAITQDEVVTVTCGWEQKSVSWLIDINQLPFVELTTTNLKYVLNAIVAIEPHLTTTLDVVTLIDTISINDLMAQSSM